MKQIQWRFDAKKVDDAYLQNKKAEMLNEVENRLKELNEDQLEALIGKVGDLEKPGGDLFDKDDLVDSVMDKLTEDKIFNQMMSVQ